MSRSWYLYSWLRHRGYSADILFLIISTSDLDPIGCARLYNLQISNVAVKSNQSGFTSYIISVRDVLKVRRYVTSYHVTPFLINDQNLVSKSAKNNF